MATQSMDNGTANTLNKDHNSLPSLGMELVAHMGDITRDRIQDMALENARNNLTAIQNGESLKALRNIDLGKGDKAIIIAAGPSLRRKNVAEQLLSTNYDGAIIATESSMLYCLRQGIIPDLVVTVDPHPKRIVRWFGDPDLTQADLKADDYFERQDLDTSFSEALRTNDEILELLNKYGPQMRIAVSSSSANTVVTRAHQSAMQVYWWNPMYDDMDQPNSVTQTLLTENGLPCVNAGGNVGSAAWMMANAVLNKQRIAVTGMDLGYYADTPYKNTQYYHEAVALVGEDRLDEIYMPIYNPHLEQWFYTDPAYMWYRECLLQMTAHATCETYNCTEGGTFFGDNIHFIPLSEFLAA
ncbi:MAG: DUF115 domain-containing protein [Ectothiorhodospiraceae bacterium]|nr:DUF115 domain-containing protein [Ectothiorhodospiraceae bacterium]